MGSLAQNSSGAIRCSFNARFRARFRRVQKVPVQSLGQVPEVSGVEFRSSSGRFRYRAKVRFRRIPLQIRKVPVQIRKVPVQKVLAQKVPAQIPR